MVKRSIWAARLVILVAFLDLFLQFPIVAPYAVGLGATPALVGVIVGLYSATNLVGNVLAGLALDRFGRKWPVLIGLLLSAAALAGYSLARTPERLLGARAIHGLATAVLTPGAFAIIGDSAAADRRARVMGSSGALIAIAAVTGPMVAGIAGNRFGPGAVFLGAAALLALTAAVFSLLARETIAAPRVVTGLRADWLGPRGLLTQPRLVVAYLAALALTIGLGTLVTHLPLLLAARGESPAGSGLAFTIYALVAMLALAGPLNRLSDRYDRYGPLAAGLALIATGLFVMAGVDGVPGIATGMALYGFGFGLLFPSATALVADAASPAERGAAFGIFYAVYSFGVVVGSVLSGLLVEWGGTLATTPFVVGGLVASLVAPTVLLVGRRLVTATLTSRSLS